MKKLISNELNVKALVSNIKKGTLPNLVLLSGPFGTGKTEFSKDIARMITCEDLTDEGYCGACQSCLTPISLGSNAFNAHIQLLNMERVTYEEMENLVKQATQKLRTRPEVFIFDEMQGQDEKSQDIWLAETEKLTDCFIIMTTTDKRAVSKGIQSRSIQISMRTLTPLQAKDLIEQHFPNVSDKIVRAIVRKASGSPRELINLAKYYYESGLEEDEILNLLTGIDTTAVIVALEMLNNREEFFEAMKELRMLHDYQIREGLRDVIWTYLASTPTERADFDYLRPFDEKQLINALNLANTDAQLAILKLFQWITLKPPVNDDYTAIKSTDNPIPQNGTQERFDKVEKW